MGKWWYYALLSNKISVGLSISITELSVRRLELRCQMKFWKIEHLVHPFPPCIPVPHFVFSYYRYWNWNGLRTGSNWSWTRTITAAPALLGWCHIRPVPIASMSDHRAGQFRTILSRYVQQWSNCSWLWSVSVTPRKRGYSINHFTK